MGIISWRYKQFFRIFTVFIETFDKSLDGAFIDQLIFDNVTAEMKCCTPSYRIPTLEWVNCSSITECTLKQSACLTQNKCQPGDYVISEEIDKSKMKNGCLTFNTKERPHGLLKCVVKGVHKIVAQAMVYYYNPENEYEGMYDQ
jgi:hypothetical protein